MGRLFWKFFFFLWLAQLTTAIGVGVAMWLITPLMDQAHGDMRPPKPPDILISSAASILNHGGKDALQSFLLEQSKKPFPPIFVVDDSNHELLNRPFTSEMIDQANQWVSLHDINHMAEKIITSDGHTYLLFAPPSPDQHPDERMDPPHDRGLFPPVMPLLSGSLVSFVFAFLLAWYFSMPIRKLRSAFESVSKGLLDVRLGAVMGNRHDELADLGRDFDNMASQFQQLMNGQKRMLHDVSHELRSPLARLQAAIGLARQQPERTEDSLSRIQRESERMDTLVSELLTISRLEAGMMGKLDDDVAITELVTDLVKDARFEAEASGYRIEFEKCGKTVVHGNAELLHRAVENVVRNAMKHSPVGGLINIKLQKKNENTICIYVTDEGPGVPEADIKSIFEPFFRSEASKFSDGHGLGLAISLRVINAHQGSIYATNRPSGGLCVTITLPVHPLT